MNKKTLNNCQHYLVELVVNEKQPSLPIYVNADEQFKTVLLVSKVKLLKLDFSKQQKCETNFKLVVSAFQFLTHKLCLGRFLFTMDFSELFKQTGQVCSVSPNGCFLVCA